jgi:hypothetical protein
MSLNDHPVSKEILRREIAAYTEKFLVAGGRIRRDRGRRVTIKCRLCSARRWVLLVYALRFKPACTQCGGEARIEI